MFSPTLLVLLFLVTNTQGSYKTYYLEDHCESGPGPAVHLSKTGPSSSAIVRVSRQDGYQPEVTCRMRIKPPFDEVDDSEEEDNRNPPEYGLIIVVDSLNLRSKYYGCIDTLQISSQRPRGEWTHRLTTCYGNYSGWTMSSLAEPDSRDLLVEFWTGPDRAGSGYGLELTVTAYALQTVLGCPSKRGADSTANWFGCLQHERCVWRGLTCDGRNNCGDDSDEWQQDGAKCGVNRRQAIIGVSVSLGCIAILALLIIGCRVRKMRREAPPSAPLRVPVANRNRSERDPLLEPGYGDPPPYDQQSQYPPPPAYRE